MTISHQIRVAASLNAHSIFAGLSGGKEPPMHNPPVRRSAPPERPKPELTYQEGDWVAFPEKPHIGYKVDQIDQEKNRVYIFLSGNKISTWVGTHQVILHRKAKERQH